MIFGVILGASKVEEQIIRKCLSKLTAYYTEEKLEIETFSTAAALLVQLEKTDLLDMAIIDVTSSQALEIARMIRRDFSQAEILVIADISVSPMRYMHPSIRASALLLRPIERGWENALRDFYEVLLTKNCKEQKKDVLWIENRDDTFRIPFAQIYYLEAREKKIFIRTKLEEFGVNGTIERFTEQLPENFVRCHRSFIVNMEYITQIKLSENILYLGNRLFVPVSRSYRGIFKRHKNV